MPFRHRAEATADDEGAWPCRPQLRSGSRGESWRNEVIGLKEAATRLGVHYMTVYRYVRTGRLPAEKTRGEWRVDPEDVDRLGRQAPVARASGSHRRWATGPMTDRLLAGDELGAWSVTESALAAGAEPADVHLELLAPALRAVGERWEAGDIDVGDEHRASVIAHRVIGRLGPRFNRPGRKRGVVVLGAVAGERHELPGAIVADQLRGAGFEVADLGADTPAESFVLAARQLGAACVLISVTGPGHEAAVAEVVGRLRFQTDSVVLVGGAAVPDEATALALGSDRWTGPDARHVVAVVEELFGRG
jgi:MerR family transcriptional regulator, light-induced transcriptional regulator